jgi:BNR repeat-like domain
MKIQHGEVYYETGRYGGWPANHGIWSWDNEILVGFTRGYYKDMGSGHHIDPDAPRENCLARSLDGGQTWQLERPNDNGYLLPYGDDLRGPAALEGPGEEPAECPGAIDFTQPDFALTFRASNAHGSEGAARFSCSHDRGRTWQGPYRFPNLHTPGVGARTDYVVYGSHDCIAFLTAAKTNGYEGRPFCARTRDGGATWRFLSWIGPEPELYAIMPATVRTGDGELVTVIRRKEGDLGWLNAYVSADDGLTWAPLDDPASDLGSGNPAALVTLHDGRLCLMYGVRHNTSRMCARLSADNGRSWTEELVLRDDGVGGDMGYPRAVVRPDGHVVVVYYFTGPEHPERYIASTIWDPASL